MMQFHRIMFSILLAALLMGGLGCGEAEKKMAADEELVLGNWTQYRNRAYILLILQAQGSWESSVRIADVTSKIVKSKGAAKGSWHMEDRRLIFTVMESDIESVWRKNDTQVFDIVLLDKEQMQLKAESGWVGEWKKRRVEHTTDPVAVTTPVIPMAPVAVNLNKISSASQDRYLCLSMKIQLKELMPGQPVPSVHPKAREAVLLFLSNLIYDDVRDFEKIKRQRTRVVEILNPYMEGTVEDIEIERVLVAGSMDKVEAFLIEHSLDRAAMEEQEAEAAADASEEG